MPEGMLTEEWFAEAYGFSPQVTRDLPLECLEWFPVIKDARERAARLKQKKPGQ